MIKSSKSKIKHRFLPTLILITAFCLFSGNGSDAIESEKSEVIGFYTSGCIANSLPLPEAGTGYQVIRLSRKRFYGHPDLIGYIKSLGQSVASYLTGTLLIGDLSQEKGGPLPDDHNSHQNGLDADILFWQNPIAKTRILSISERENIYPLSLLTTTNNYPRIDYSKWNSIHVGILKIAASSGKVDRIFVNPLIKRNLCTMYEGEDWLSKIRPWWGHDGHFHVRLSCPDNSPLCKPQKPVPEGDGCDTDLDSWLRKIAHKKTMKKDDEPKPKSMRLLPKACLTLLSEY